MAVSVNNIAPPTSTGRLSKGIAVLNRVVDPVSKASLVLACAMLTGMMFLTFADVAGSQLGKWSLIGDHTGIFKPILGGQELQELFMVIVVSFALAYTAIKKGHIRVDLLMQFTSEKVNRWFGFFANLFSCLFYILIAWQAWTYAWINVHDQAVTGVLNIAIFPFNLLLMIGAAITALIFLRDFLESVGEVIR
jgi:TRAP-type mannitol/chloroaromatic compound transport system permease small subunit